MTRTTRTLLATAATLALLAGAALAQGPRFGGAVPNDAATAQRDQVRQQIHEPGSGLATDAEQTQTQTRQRIHAPDDAAAPARAARTVQAQRRLQVEDGEVGPMHEQIADALGITAGELTAKHAEGLTLVEIAESLGVDLDDLPVGPAQAGGRNLGGMGGAGQAHGPQGRMQRDAPRGQRN